MPGGGSHHNVLELLLLQGRMSSAKKGASSASLHKVIMVGSGGVGKSALTLQVSSTTVLDKGMQATQWPSTP